MWEFLKILSTVQISIMNWIVFLLIFSSSILSAQVVDQSDLSSSQAESSGISVSSDSSVQIQVVGEIDLSISQTESSDPVTVSQPYSYNLTVNNAGPGVATNVVVNDDLPNEVGFVSATGNDWSCGLQANNSSNLSASFEEAVTNNTIDWRLRSGNTPSSGTGPVAASHGSNYMYIEASGPNYPNKLAVLGSSLIDLSDASSASLSFDYHMYGSAMGSLDVQFSSDGVNFASVLNASGDQGNSWHTAKIDASAYIGGNLYLRFRGVTGSSFTSDIAIDNVVLTGNTESSFSISFEDNENTPVTLSNGDVLIQGQSDDMSWIQNQFDDTSWSSNVGGTPSTATGPDAASHGNNYLYIESSSPNYPNKTAILESNPIDLSNASSASFSFDYHMYGASMGSLDVQFSSDGISFTSAWDVNGNQGDSWHTTTLDASAYIGGNLYLRFRGVTGGSYTSDIAIDNIRLIYSGGGDINIVSCTRDLLEVGIAPAIIINVTAPASVGTVTNNVTVTSDATEVNPANNSVTEETTITIPNAVPSIIQNQGLTVLRGSQDNSLSSEYLLATDTEDNDDTLVYVLLDPLPAHGTLKKNGVPLDLAGNSQFTQADINNSLISYDSSGASNNNDSFTFKVKDSNGSETAPEIYTIIVIIPDTDEDGINDDIDNCPVDANADQADLDSDGLGDACDSDRDGDGVDDDADNCPVDANADQADLDSDDLGDACDSDRDGDGINDDVDNCPVDANADQANLDSDDLGDVCDSDRDGDGINDDVDNCPVNANADQSNLDGDSLGDVCDPDRDDDGINDDLDNCPINVNADQANLDEDSFGDVCDADRDGDEVNNDEDVYPDDPTRWILNNPPVISGTPASIIEVGESTSGYSFSPTASDADDDELTWMLSAPELDWISFNDSTGAVTFTPGYEDVGTHGPIVISASDGLATVALPEFFIEIRARVDLAISSVGVSSELDPEPVTAVNLGQENTFYISVSNNGAVGVTGATVLYELNSAFTNVNWTCNSDPFGLAPAPEGMSACTASGSGSINDSVTLPVGGAVQYAFTATVDPAATLDDMITARITPPANVVDPDMLNNSARYAGELVPTVDIATTITINESEWVAGEPVTFEVSATNAGPSGTGDVELNLSAHDRYIDYSYSWSCTASAGASCTSSGLELLSDIGVSLPAGGVVTYTVNAIVPADVTGTLDLSVVGSHGSSINELNLDNNNATDSVNIVLPNTAPTISQNKGLTVFRGSQNNIIGNEYLAAADTEDDDITLIYLVDTIPVFGTLEKAGTALTVDEQFTQADVNNGLISYKNIGDNDNNDSFAFRVKDSGNIETVLSTFIFTVEIPDQDSDGINDDEDNCPADANADQVNLDEDELGDVCDPDRDGDGINNDEDVYPDNSERSEANQPPTLTGNLSLVVDAGASIVINSSNLAASDDFDAELTYEVISEPIDGVLHYIDAPSVPLTAFTQTDIDDGNVIYFSVLPFVGVDQFTVSITDSDGAKTQGTMIIEVMAVDEIAPNITISDVPTVIHAPVGVPAIFTFTEPVGNFTAASITVTNGSVTNFSTTSSTVYRAEITPNGGGDVFIEVPAGVVQDNAGNPNQAATPVTLKYDGRNK